MEGHSHHGYHCWLEQNTYAKFKLDPTQSYKAKLVKANGILNFSGCRQFHAMQ